MHHQFEWRLIVVHLFTVWVKIKIPRLNKLLIFFSFHMPKNVYCKNSWRDGSAWLSSIYERLCSSAHEKTNRTQNTVSKIENAKNTCQTFSSYIYITPHLRMARKKTHTYKINQKFSTTQIDLKHQSRVVTKKHSKKTSFLLLVLCA